MFLSILRLTSKLLHTVSVLTKLFLLSMDMSGCSQSIDIDIFHKCASHGKEYNMIGSSMKCIVVFYILLYDIYCFTLRLGARKPAFGFRQGKTRGYLLR